MYEVIYTGQFRRSFKLCARRGLNIQDFTTVLDILQEKGELPAQYRPHQLSGKYKGCWAVEIFFAFFLGSFNYISYLCQRELREKGLLCVQ